ncbi:4'-phosphopantetheinyl transferase family protein [Chryseobacterium luteum]|uniref:Uncharacterized protein n=1 Tax=Chryseobacterium luteum TaxID=421531 RepID=A0A085ZH50_9FLAO|nr:4'-phosphopantetheinyl transferase superfamily protein [Chryseobacterium luteum]KFF03764.1 hypothetical protein IX38_10125 [Chryseobacterium luteum]
MKILYAFIDEGCHKTLMDDYLSICADDENFKNKILKYRRWQDAQASLIGRMLLKYGLSNYFGITNFKIEKTNDNKPFLKNKNIQFNISHSKDLVVCIITDYFPVGIDVEFIDYTMNYLDFKYQMTDNELKIIEGSENRTRSFFSYWTSKEAVIKAYGKGLKVALKSFKIVNNHSSIDNHQFELKEIFINENYHCCIAANGNIRSKNIYVKQLSLNEL